MTVHDEAPKNADRALVTVTRRFAAEAERIFATWTAPAQVTRWMGLLNPAEPVVSVAVDLRIGGEFSFVVHRNGNDIDHFGDYVRIDRPSHLVFTWMGPAGSPDSAVVDLSIADAGDHRLLTLRHDMPAKWAAMAPRIEGSWTRMLEAIGRILEQP